MNDAIELALAEMVEGLEKLATGVQALTQRDGFKADGLESAMADMVEQLQALAEQKPLDLAPVVNAIKGLKLSASPVNVNVQPTPVQVKVEPPTVNLEATIQTPQWESLAVSFKREGDTGRIEQMTIRKIK